MPSWSFRILKECPFLKLFCATANAGTFPSLLFFCHSHVLIFTTKVFRGALQEKKCTFNFVFHSPTFWSPTFPDSDFHFRFKALKRGEQKRGIKARNFWGTFMVGRKWKGHPAEKRKRSLFFHHHQHRRRRRGPRRRRRRRRHASDHNVF